jgi:hypothetical protein
LDGKREAVMNGFDLFTDLPEAEALLAAVKGQNTQLEKDACALRIVERQRRALAVSNLIRPFLPKNMSLLFHGSRFANEIVRENLLRHSEHGTRAVHFSRDLRVATQWALLERREGDEGFGAVLVFDRDRLSQDHRLECFRDVLLDNGNYPKNYSEADEIVRQKDVLMLHRYLLDVIWIDEFTGRARSARSTKRARESGRRNVLTPPTSIRTP